MFGHNSFYPILWRRSSKVRKKTHEWKNTLGIELNWIERNEMNYRVSCGKFIEYRRYTQYAHVHMQLWLTVHQLFSTEKYSLLISLVFVSLSLYLFRHHVWINELKETAIHSYYTTICDDRIESVSVSFSFFVSQSILIKIIIGNWILFSLTVTCLSNTHIQIQTRDPRACTHTYCDVPSPL